MRKKTKTNQDTHYFATLNCRNEKNLTLFEYKAPHNSQLSEQKKKKKQFKFTRIQIYSLLSIVGMKKREKKYENILDC